MGTALPLLAAFVTPALFFGGATVVSAPILIHLLARRRFKRIRWAAMDFLIDAERRNRRRIRMEEWILLALRCLAVLLIALLLARPFIKPEGLAAFLGGSKQIERIFVLDDSFSMAYQSGEVGPEQATSFDRAKQATRRLLATIRQETPDDTVTVIRMSAPTTPVESGIYLDDAQSDDLLARLDALTPTERSIDLVTVVESLADFLTRNPDITNTVIYLVSDFQHRDWVLPEAATQHNAEEVRESSLFEPLATWAKEDRGLRLVLVNVGDENAVNLAVTELAIHGGQLVAGAGGTVRARVANFGNESVENLELTLSVGHVVQPSKTIGELAPHQEAAVDLDAEFLQAGYESVQAQLLPDALPLDNTRYVATEVAEAIRILIVNGEPSSDEFDNEVTFLVTALRPEGEVFSGNEVSVIDEAELEAVNLPKFHVVVLANVYRVSEPAIESLERFTKSGGGLLFFLGDQVDADLYNLALYREGEGLLPAELTEVIRSPNVSHLTVTDRLHPAMRGLGGAGDPLGIADIAFFEYFGCAPPVLVLQDVDEEQGDPETASQETVRPARVIARFDDAESRPAIVERRFGRGMVVLVTTTADKEWHLWPDHPTFLPVVMELVRHVARRSDGGVDHRIGEPIELPLDPATFNGEVLVRTPAYPNEREVRVMALPASDGRGLTLTWEHTDSAGLYRFLLRRREGGETVRLVAVNVDSGESDLTMANEGELGDALGELPFDYIKGSDAVAGLSNEARTELWRFFLVSAFLVLMSEQCLAWWWGKRG